MRFSNQLNNVRVASPCPADWDQMLGNDRSRFCGQCNLNVYNLSAMSRSEAEEFIARSEGRVCIRYYRRKDGSIITENCPVGLRALKKRMSQIAAALASAILTFLTGLGFFFALDRFSKLRDSTVMGTMAVAPSLDMTPVVIDTPIQLEQGQFFLSDAKTERSSIQEQIKVGQ
jgi:hypothetical protein